MVPCARRCDVVVLVVLVALVVPSALSGELRFGAVLIYALSALSGELRLGAVLIYALSHTMGL